MTHIKVVVTKVVAVDRDAARGLLRSYSDWVNRNVIPRKDAIEQKDVEDFLVALPEVAPEDVTR